MMSWQISDELKNMLDMLLLGRASLLLVSELNSD